MSYQCHWSVVYYPWCSKGCQRPQDPRTPLFLVCSRVWWPQAQPEVRGIFQNTEENHVEIHKKNREWILLKRYLPPLGTTYEGPILNAHLSWVCYSRWSRIMCCMKCIAIAFSSDEIVNNRMNPFLQIMKTEYYLLGIRLRLRRESLLIPLTKLQICTLWLKKILLIEFLTIPRVRIYASFRSG